MATPETPFGPTGEVVYRRTYARTKADGTVETWPETVDRVVSGNIALLHGDYPSDWPDDAVQDYLRLKYYMNRLAIIPAGRQLWAMGVPGRQYLFNCHVAGWGPTFGQHFAFTFMRLVEGGGVGANYTTDLWKDFGAPRNEVDLVLTIDPSHPDYEKVRPYAGESRVDDPLEIEDTREGWADALKWIIDIVMSDAYTYDRPVTLELDLSAIRPEGSPLVSSGGTAAGPAPLARMLTQITAVINKAAIRGHFTPIDLMEMDHEIAVGAVAGGKRRSARMSIVKWDDPYVFDFINAKADGMSHWSTNISVEIDDEFLRQLDYEGDPMDCRDMRAFMVHMAVCEAVLRNGEPGYWNSSLSNVGEQGLVIATNPCGEIPLQPWEACNLGNVNMDWFATRDGWDQDALDEAHRLITRFLIRSTYADINDPRQREIQDKNRRIGVGHHGVQGFFAKSLGLRYSEFADDPRAIALIDHLYEVVVDEARSYAHKLRIPEPIKRTCIAPGGSTPKLAGITEGAGVLYARWFEQRVRFSLRDEDEFNQVSDYRAQGFAIEDDVYDPSGMTAVVVFPTENNLIQEVRDFGHDPAIVESADQLSIEDMLRVQAFYQEHWADNAVSYTANVPAGSITPEALSRVLAKYLTRLKGTTIMIDDSREQAPYTRITEEEYIQAVAHRVSDSIDEACATGACPIR